jgi:hypothetical protein
MIGSDLRPGGSHLPARDDDSTDRQRDATPLHCAVRRSLLTLALPKPPENDVEPQERWTPAGHSIFAETTTFLPETVSKLGGRGWAVEFVKHNM